MVRPETPALGWSPADRGAWCPGVANSGEELMTITNLDLRASPYRVAPRGFAVGLPHRGASAWQEPGQVDIETMLAARATAGASA